MPQQILNEFLQVKHNLIYIDLIVSPKASRSQLKAIYDKRLKIQLAAAPVDGEANKELIEFISDIFSIPKKSVQITSGLSSKRKTIAVAGILPEKVQQILSQHLKNQT